MKKNIFLLGIVFTVAIVCSFQVLDKKNLKKTEENEIKLLVTSDDPFVPVIFDACLISDKGRDELKAQTTPFEMVIVSETAKLLFNKISGDTKVNYKVIGAYGSVSASWPISVIIIDQGKMETFGL